MIRTVLRRVLLAWWAIPCTVVVLWPMAYLLCGARDANEITADICGFLWNGME